MGKIRFDVSTKSKKPQGDIVAKAIFNIISSNKTIFYGFRLFVSFIFTPNFKCVGFINQKIRSIAFINLMLSDSWLQKNVPRFKE